jgi:hypothetical protein
MTAKPSKSKSAPSGPLRAAKLRRIPFVNAPFPFRGRNPETGRPFYDLVKGRRHGHTSGRDGVKWEKKTYSDRRSLLYLPQGFDINRPALIVVYLHGNRSKLLRDVRDRQRVPEQIAESGLNAALVAPQLAVDALDSSAGRFWQPGAFSRYLREAAGQLAKLHGDPRARRVFARAPVVIVAYSGGYHPAAYALLTGGANERLLGVILLDAPYGEEEMLAEWVSRRRAHAFFLSVYTAPPREHNERLMQLMSKHRISFQTSLPGELTAGTVAFYDAGDGITHEDFVTLAWTENPLAFLLALIPDFSRVDPSQPHNRR